MVFSSFPISS
ncbi:hypothetical protein HZS_7790 [Henneguya salminicola]|nr:hypothetical protein HZS_7790 [Henneguya salminicola]